MQHRWFLVCSLLLSAWGPRSDNGYTQHVRCYY
jgi:hypothetical protein